MAYQLVELKLENITRRVTDTNPLYASVGGLSPNDMTILKTSIVVPVVTGTATMKLQHSPDGGSTWEDIPLIGTTGTISTPGTYSAWITEFSGIPFPTIRLVVTADAGGSLYIARAYKTLSTGNNVIPRATVTLPPGQATEAKQDTIIGHIDGLEAGVASTNTKLDTLNAKDLATSTKQDTLIGHVDGLETAVAATNTKLDTLNAKNFATEATLQKVRQWPYANWDANTETWDGITFTETQHFRTGGTSGAIVGTIVTVYTDSTRVTRVSSVYTPAKAV